MKVDVPGRGAVDIGRVAVVGPAWTDPDMYRETCALLQRTADAAAGDAGAIEFGWLPWSVGTNGQMLRRMVRDLAAECDDGSPCVDAVCLLPGWNTDGPTTFAAAVANTCGAVVMGLEEWLRALEPDDAERGEEASGQ
ncbi:MAG: hypothetical protein ACLVHF_00150 [Collinsella sp.]